MSNTEENVLKLQQAVKAQTDMIYIVDFKLKELRDLLGSMLNETQKLLHAEQAKLEKEYKDIEAGTYKPS